jgi:hypothetical protein
MSYVQYIWKHEGFGVSNKYGRKKIGTDDLMSVYICPGFL